jgi:hypothetical protein
MRRSSAVRLTLLPLLAAASLARAQEWPGSSCRQDDPSCAWSGAEYQYQYDANAAFDPYYWYDPLYLIVPVQRQGFGTYFWMGIAG